MQNELPQLTALHYFSSVKVSSKAGEVFGALLYALHQNGARKVTLRYASPLHKTLLLWYENLGKLNQQRSN